MICDSMVEMICDNTFEMICDNTVEMFCDNTFEMICDNTFEMILNHFGVIILGFLIRGTKLGSSGEPTSGSGEPPPPRYTIRFSILTLRTPKASLVGENWHPPGFRVQSHSLAQWVESGGVDGVGGKTWFGPGTSLV